MNSGKRRKPKKKKRLIIAKGIFSFNLVCIEQEWQSSRRTIILQRIVTVISRSRSRSRNGGDGVILVVLRQIGRKRALREHMRQRCDRRLLLLRQKSTLKYQPPLLPNKTDQIQLDYSKKQEEFRFRKHMQCCRSRTREKKKDYLIPSLGEVVAPGSRFRFRKRNRGSAWLRRG